MSEGPVRTCPDCGQPLRFPDNIGGMLMACPVCGHRFASPFRLATGTSSPAPASNATFTASRTASAPTPPASGPAAAKPIRHNTLAARVAALYAAKAR